MADLYALNFELRLYMYGVSHTGLTTIDYGMHAVSSDTRKLRARMAMVVGNILSDYSGDIKLPAFWTRSTDELFVGRYEGKSGDKAIYEIRVTIDPVTRI